MVYGTGVVFGDESEHFTGNFDESCFMVNRYGSIKIVSSVSKKRTENNCDNFLASVTSLKGGNCFGNQGPLIFLSRGKSVGPENFRELDSYSILPIRSHVATSTNAHTNDEVYPGLVPKSCARVSVKCQSPGNKRRRRYVWSLYGGCIPC